MRRPAPTRERHHAGGRRRLALAALLAAAAGCGSGSSDGRACRDQAVARCDIRDRCTNDLGILVRYGDRATCEEREALDCVLALGAGGDGYGRADVVTCTAALPSQECNPLFNDLPVAACAVPPGARADGEGCVFNGQCQSAYCSLPSGTRCGQCAPAPATGVACPNPGEVVVGFACSKVTGQWVQLAAEGGACDAATPCGAGLVCVGSIPSQQVQGVCMAAVTTAAAACDPTRQSGPDCDRNQGLYCAADSTCAPLGLAEPWGDCGRLLDGSSAMCTWGSVCVFPSGSRQGTCVQAVPDGYICNSVNGPPCLAPARCIADGDGGSSGTCELSDPALCP